MHWPDVINGVTDDVTGSIGPITPDIIHRATPTHLPIDLAPTHFALNTEDQGTGQRSTVSRQHKVNRRFSDQAFSRCLIVCPLWRDRDRQQARLLFHRAIGVLADSR